MGPSHQADESMAPCAILPFRSQERGRLDGGGSGRADRGGSSCPCAIWAQGDRLQEESGFQEGVAQWGSHGPHSWPGSQGWKMWDKPAGPQGQCRVCTQPGHGATVWGAAQCCGPSTLSTEAIVGPPGLVAAVCSPGSEQPRAPHEVELLLSSPAFIQGTDGRGEAGL